MRELWEEAGVTGRQWRRLPAWSYDRWADDGKHFLVVLFQCVTTDVPMRRERHKCLRWQCFAPGERPSPLYPASELRLRAAGF